MKRITIDATLLFILICLKLSKMNHFIFKTNHSASFYIAAFSKKVSEEPEGKGLGCVMRRLLNHNMRKCIKRYYEGKPSRNYELLKAVKKSLYC